MVLRVLFAACLVVSLILPVSAQPPDDTAWIQALLDAVPVEGGSVYLPARTYWISTLTIKARTLLYGDGNGTELKSLPGNTAPFLVTNQGLQARRIRIKQLRINGNKAEGSTSGGIGFDHTTVAGAALHRIDDVRIEDCGGNGLTLIQARSLSIDGLHVENCDGHGIRNDGTSYDNHFANTIVGNSGLHNVWTSAGGYFDELHSYWSGRLDPVNFGDAFYADGWGIHGILRGKLEDSARHGFHLNPLGLPAVWVGWDIDVFLANIEGDAVRLAGGHKNVLTIHAADHGRRAADAIVNILGGSRNVITGYYEPEMLKPEKDPIQGNPTGNTVALVAL